MNSQSKKPLVKLIGEDGNIFGIFARVNKAMKKFEIENPNYNAIENFDNFLVEAKSGDYDKALQTVIKYCEVN